MACMTLLTTPPVILRPQRDALRRKTAQTARARSARSQAHAPALAASASADCVFKRLPAIGETPLSNFQHW